MLLPSFSYDRHKAGENARVCACAESAFRDAGLWGQAVSASVTLGGITVTPSEVTSIHHPLRRSCKLFDLY